MPRLSVIIPHLADPGLLENSLLSVLENRPPDTEIILVHNGSYADPYQLSDELVLVDAGPTSNLMDLINAGVLAACAPIVNTVIEGVVVTAGWSDNAVDLMQGHAEVGAMAIPVRRRASLSYGLDAQKLKSVRNWKTAQFLSRRSAQICAAPEIACGFFRKSLLMALDGFAPVSNTLVAEVDFATCLEKLGQGCLCDTHAEVEAPRQTTTAGQFQHLANLAVQQGLVPGGILSAIKEFPFLLSAPRRAWAQGLLGSQTGHARLKHAQEQLAIRRAAQTKSAKTPRATTVRRAA